MIIDTHAHLMFPEFKKDFEEVLKRAKDTGISKIVNVGCDLKSCQQSLEMGAKYLELFSTLGMHPYEASLVNEDLLNEWRKIIAENKKVVAIGECGLDYFKSTVDHDVQKKAFRLQIKLAQEFDLPLIIHNRDDDHDCLQVLDEMFAKGKKVSVVFHCYGSNLEFAEKLWERGIYTSFTGIVTYPNAKDVKEVVAKVPMNLFMVETDCPYLAPQAYRGKRNEPSYVTEIVREIAKLKRLSFKDVEYVATKNALEFFRIEELA